MDGTRNRNKFEEIMQRTSKFDKNHYSCVAVFERIPNKYEMIAEKIVYKGS